MKKYYSIIVAGLLSLTLFSCKTQQVKLTYFDNASEGTVLGSNDYEILIAPDDELMITISSLVPAATGPYNLPITNYTKNELLPGQNTQLQYSTYLVDTKGDIDMPILGKVHVAGFTTNQIKENLRDLVSKSVESPVVTVKLVNFKVNVIGEVNAPGAYTVNRERYSVLDALAAAGDLSIYGLRDQVYIIREENGAKTFHHLDITDANIVSSPYFYLRQNDVVYVAPNKVRIENSKYNQNNAYKLSVISTIVSAASVIASLVIALTVK